MRIEKLSFYTGLYTLWTIAFSGIKVFDVITDVSSQ